MTSNHYYMSVVSDVKVCKMYDLEVGKEYLVDRIIESRFGYICIVNKLDPEDPANYIQMSPNSRAYKLDQIKFYANKSLRKYIEDNKIEKFFLRINALKDCTIDDKDYKYPLYDVAIVRRVPEMLKSGDYESIIA